MDNHVHLIAIPEAEDSFARGFAEAHRRYTRMINFRENWRGYLWEGRFKSYPLSYDHLYTAMRYIENNPLRAKIVKNAWDYPWSSARAHVFKQNDPLLDKCFMTTEIASWKQFLSQEDEQNDISSFRIHSNTGRPLGNNHFITSLENITDRVLHKQKPGPKQIIK